MKIFVLNEASSEQALTQIVKFLWDDDTEHLPIPKLIEAMRANINPATSGTFRKGKIGTWKEEFDEEVLSAFKEEAGQLLIGMGYEQDLNW